MNEFGEFVGASSSTLNDPNDASTQNSSNVMNSTKNEYSDVNVQKEHESNGGNCKVYAENSKKNSHDLSSVSRSMIDELFDENIGKQGTSLVNKIHAVIFHFLVKIRNIYDTCLVPILLSFSAGAPGSKLAKNRKKRGRNLL